MEHFLRHLAIHASKDPVGTITAIGAAVSNPVTWGVAAVAGVTYLVVKACE